MAFPDYGNLHTEGSLDPLLCVFCFLQGCVCASRKEELKEHGDSHGRGVILELWICRIVEMQDTAVCVLHQARNSFAVQT